MENTSTANHQTGVTIIKKKKTWQWLLKHVNISSSHKLVQQRKNVTYYQYVRGEHNKHSEHVEDTSSKVRPIKYLWIFFKAWN